MERRSFLKMAAVTGATLAAPAILRAQNRRFEGVTLSINAYGGDYTRILQESVAKPLEERTGLQVTYQSGTVASAVAMLIAARDNPPFDLIMTDSPNVPDLLAADIIEPVATDEVSNMHKIVPGVRQFGDYGVPFLTNCIVLTRNTDHVAGPITSYRDLARSDLADRVGIFTPENTGGVLTLIALSELHGGDLDNMDPAFEALEEMRGNIAAVTPSTVSLLQLLEQEEVWAAPYWDGRIHSMRAAGRPMDLVIPDEGIYAIYNYLHPIKGTEKREAILAYIEQTLSDESVLPFVEFFRYGPVTDIELPPDLANDVVISATKNRDLMKEVDWAKVAQNRGEWADRFNRVMR
jgi:putative spermidine/putrescine transport system substrate-binding protein